MKKLILPLTLAVGFLCCGCENETINALNPVVQAAKMQNAAKKTVDEVTQIQQYKEQIDRQQLQNLYDEE